MELGCSGAAGCPVEVRPYAERIERHAKPTLRGMRYGLARRLAELGNELGLQQLPPGRLFLGGGQLLVRERFEADEIHPLFE